MNYDDFIAIASQLRPSPVISTRLPSRVEWDSYSKALQKSVFDSATLLVSIQQGKSG
jgi:hypothetical protein